MEKFKEYKGVIVGLIKALAAYKIGAIAFHKANALIGLGMITNTRAVKVFNRQLKTTGSTFTAARFAAAAFGRSITAMLAPNSAET